MTSIRWKMRNIKIIVLIVCFLISGCSRGGSSSDDGSSKSGSPQGIRNDAPNRRSAMKDRLRSGISHRRNIEGREVRTYDGSENNLNNIEWGAAFSRLQRFASSNYSDGISEFAGVTRPNPRVISNQISNQAEGESIPNLFRASDFLWQWGQFIDHDLDLSDGVAEEGDNARLHDIKIPPGDTYFDPQGTGEQVITFNRARYDESTGSDSGNPREQENEISSWIDASNVYGSYDERVAAIRVGTNSAFLRTSAGNLLPFNSDNLTNANGPVTDPTTLFLAGDVRANEQVALTVMHTLFVREHNRLATLLLEERPDADPNNVFHSARRMVIAQLQMITYKEFLPALIGPGAIPPYTGYNSNVNGTIFNEFSVAAYRLGHSAVNAQILRLNANGNVINAGHLSLRDAFFSSSSILNSSEDLEPILRGLASQVHQSIDLKIVSDLRNFLFGQPGSGGLDLASLNIQRGRDHGVRSYNDTREALGLSRVSSFSEITSDSDMQAALSQTYGSVDSIDLWVGGLAEDMVGEGSQLGPLFRTIIIRQFTALRDGDRFWYQRDLSPQEMELVRGTTLARVIRNNTGIGSELQDNVFFVR